MRPSPTRFKALREDRALSQEALAAKCGLSRKTVQRIERGAEVRPETLAVIAVALGVPVSDLTSPQPGRDAPHNQVTLRRVRSGQHIVQQLGRSDIGRVDCDVDADGATLAPLTDLVTRAQGLMRDRWDVPRPSVQDMPLVERLRLIAALNEDLRALEAHGIGFYMGHYQRFAARPGATEAAALDDLQRRPIVLTRVLITLCQRERILAPVETAWTGAPEGFGEGRGAVGADAAGEATVFLYPKPPLAPTDNPDGDFLEGVFDVIPRRP